MSEKSYFDKFKDPRWQKKRLKIMERDGFKCEGCGAGDKTLSVHHGYYDKDLDPWEYDDITLHCVCDECHKMYEDLKKRIYRCIAICNLVELDFLSVSIPGAIHDDVVEEMASSSDALKGSDDVDGFYFHRIVDNVVNLPVCKKWRPMHDELIEVLKKWQKKVKGDGAFVYAEMSEEFWNKHNEE